MTMYPRQLASWSGLVNLTVENNRIWACCKMKLIFAHIVYHLVLLSFINGVVTERGMPCTYFGGVRVSSNEDNLVNCTWYASNACCKRTEVTSVFGSMLPLYGSSAECANHINYLMCYFCSPEQHLWYDKSAHICSEFCEAVFEHCKTASFNGTVLSDNYMNGEDFCLGQKFVVEKESSTCFAYDASVFDCGLHLTSCSLTVITSAILVILHTAVGMVSWCPFSHI